MIEPQVSELIEVGSKAIVGQGDRAADLIRGSDYESLIGPTAMLWVREDRRDEDLFNSTRFHTAKDADLTYLVQQRYGIDRILDTNGVGTATLVRPTAGSAGVVWAGTRITIFGGSPRFYRTTVDTSVAAADTFVNVAIEYLSPGPGALCDEVANLRLDDSLWDTTWTVKSVKCADGTTFEEASALIARVRQTRFNQRVGQVSKIQEICKAAGAGQSLVFRSDYGGPDFDGGLNVVYVGDLGYQGSPSLVKACFLALRAGRVLGDHMQVFEMARVTINPVIDVYLATAPALNDIERLQRIHTAAVVRYLGGEAGGFAFTRIGILSALARATPEVQRVSVVDPAADVTVLVGGHLPGMLNRYVVGTVALRYHGP